MDLTINLDRDLILNNQNINYLNDTINCQTNIKDVDDIHGIKDKSKLLNDTLCETEFSRLNSFNPSNSVGEIGWAGQASPGQFPQVD